MHQITKGPIIKYPLCCHIRLVLCHICNNSTQDICLTQSLFSPAFWTTDNSSRTSRVVKNIWIAFPFHKWFQKLLWQAFLPSPLLFVLTLHEHAIVPKCYNSSLRAHARARTHTHPIIYGTLVSFTLPVHLCSLLTSSLMPLVACIASYVLFNPQFGTLSLPKSLLSKSGLSAINGTFKSDFRAESPNKIPMKMLMETFCSLTSPLICYKRGLKCTKHCRQWMLPLHIFTQLQAPCMNGWVGDKRAGEGGTGHTRCQQWRHLAPL